MHKEKYKLIYLEWCDACGGDIGWCNSEDAKEWGKEGFIIRQAGWLIEESDNHVLLAFKYNPQEIEGKFSQLTRIPKTWIIKRINLNKFIFSS